jgi:integrase
MEFSQPYPHKRDGRHPGCSIKDCKCIVLWARKELKSPLAPWPLGYRPAVVTGRTKAAVNINVARYKGPAALDSRTTLAEYAEREYLPMIQADLDANEIGFAYAENLRATLTRFLLKPNLKRYPWLKDQRVDALRRAPLHRITPLVCERYFDCLKQHKAPLDARRLLKQMLGAIFRKARELMDKEYRDVLLNGVEFGKTVEKEVVIFDPAQVKQAVEDTSVPLADRLPVAFMYYVGCRPSEAWGVKWSDFTADFSDVTIRRAVRRQKRGYAATAGTKTGASRVVPIEDSLALMLREHRKTALAGAGGSQWVFTDETGHQLDNDRWGVRWPAIRDRLGLPADVPFRALRHTANSTMKEQGVPLSDRQKILGHRPGSRVTDRNYLRVSPASLREAVKALGRVSEAR